jgi:glycosyltransferase involved in cell wall biosynthesis
MKIACTFHSNSPHAATGYGQQTSQLVRRMVADDHKVAIVSNYGNEAAVSDWNGAAIFPRGWDAYNNDIVEPTFLEWQRSNPDHAHLIFTLFDVWVYQGEAWDKHPVASWVPIDHAPTPPAVKAFLAKPNVTPIAMSRFGQKMLHDAGIECEYVPHALDLSVFKMTARADLGDKRMTGREIMKAGEDRFVVGIFAANKGIPSRKALAENILAFSIFARDKPDALLYLHTNREGLGGLDLDMVVKNCALKPEQYRFVHQWGYRLSLPPTVVATMMTACDVGLLASCGEGFGIPAIELQACGTRVIVNGFSAQPELVGDGWVTECQPAWSAPHGAWSSTPSINSIVDCLNQAYAAGRGRSAKAEKFVRDNYDADTVYATQWRPVLERLAEKASASAAVIPRSFCNGKQTDPSLTIYIPTFKRPELAALLDSLAPQLVPEVEVIVSDNDGSAGPLVRERLKNAPCRVDYSRRESNIGGDANILRGFSQGSGEWIWIVGDDDVLASDAISRVLSALGDMHYGAQDRLILLSKSASKSAATAIGSLADIAKRDPALPIAATLITANVCRREAVDLATGMANVDTKYGHAWAMPSRKVAVLPHPAIERVGYLHAGQGIPEGWDGEAVKAAYLRSVGIEPKAANFKWNYMSVEAK